LLLLGSSFSLICQTIIYEQDFSNGIPSTWTTSGTSQGVSNSVIGFYYRGPNTTPNNTIGSNGFVASSGPIGLLSSNQDPILSLTPGNGFIIIDPEAYVGGFYWFMSQWMFAIPIHDCILLKEADTIEVQALLINRVKHLYQDILTDNYALAGLFRISQVTS